jgi:hypothetical protein
LSNTVFVTPWVSAEPDIGATVVGVAALVKLSENKSRLRKRLRNKPIRMYGRILGRKGIVSN